MVDKFALVLQQGMKKVPFLPDQFETPIAYLIVFAASFTACWRGHYSLFEYLDFTFAHEFEGWILTALVISGGSAFLRESFDTMNSLPGILSGMYGYVSRTVTSLNTGTKTSAKTPETTAVETEMKQGQETQV
jgi:hypothetical protein